MNRDELLAFPTINARRLSRAEIIHIFQTLEAFWMHDGTMSKPHVELTSGNHSNGYINCPEVLNHDNLRMLMAFQLAELMKDLGLEPRATDWIIGSDTSATKLAGDLAAIYDCRHGRMRKDDQKHQIWIGEDMGDDRVEPRLISKGEVAYHIEELMTTAFTAQRLREGVYTAHQDNVQFADAVLVLMNRSDVGLVDEDPVVAAYGFQITNWEKECPLCKQGSPVIREPKKNWAQLTA